MHVESGIHELPKLSKVAAMTKPIERQNVTSFFPNEFVHLLKGELSKGQFLFVEETTEK